ncbi:cytochrome b-c1 complex subunit 8 [Armillaria novae-zelandiae]|uniref:Cytochrome b-c1 complex subunit 8 n=2 Tax=Armillaria TaxID=47424 RepID=A0AA39NYF3_9AGAR|nr:cytochrome b-c1 complex subunit 8 [Armillaria novae-zelandiae]KAK0494526.1 cytochrome b-c1 complex subunit 8 [Armillaria luteobubalina]
MRPTLIRYGEMPGPQRAWSSWWGDKHGGARMKGVYQYTISPFQAKAGPNWAREYLFQGYRRIAAEVPYWIVPFAMGYGIYTWANNYTKYHDSKAAHEAGHHE